MRTAFIWLFLIICQPAFAQPPEHIPQPFATKEGIAGRHSAPFIPPLSLIPSLRRRLTIRIRYRILNARLAAGAVSGGGVIRLTMDDG